MKQIPKQLTSPRTSSKRTLTKEAIVTTFSSKPLLPVSSKLIQSSKEVPSLAATTNVFMTQLTSPTAKDLPRKTPSMLVTSPPQHHRNTSSNAVFQSPTTRSPDRPVLTAAATKEGAFKDLLNDKMGYDWQLLRSRNYTIEPDKEATSSSHQNIFKRQFTIKKLTSLELPSADRGRRFIAFSDLHTSEPAAGFDQQASKPALAPGKPHRLQQLRDLLAWNKKEADFYSTFMDRRKEDPLAPVVAERFKAPPKQRHVTDQKVCSYRSLQREINQKSKLIYRQIVKDAEKAGHVDSHISEIKKKIQKIERIKQLAKQGFQVHLKSTSRNNSLELSSSHPPEQPVPSRRLEAQEVGVTDLADLDFDFRRLAEHEDFGLVAKRCNTFTVMTPPQVRHSFTAVARQLRSPLSGKPATDILVLGGAGGEPLDTLEVFMPSTPGSPDSGQWRQAKAKPTAFGAEQLLLYKHAAEVWNGSLVLFGGVTCYKRSLAEQLTADVWLLDLDSLALAKLRTSCSEASCLAPRKCHATVLLGDELFVFGGLSDPDHLPLSDVWVFQLSTPP